MIKQTELMLMEETDFLFRKVWKKYLSFLMPETGDLSMHQMMFLKFLEHKGTCTPSDIAQQFEITLGAVTGFVDRLHRVGYVMRTRSDEDRRVVLIQLSPQGMEVLRDFEGERKKKFSCIMQKLESSSLVELKKALEQLDFVLDHVSSE
ncbi:MarR family winged helix-turn-helix transcriptional regulator [Desulfosporosinus sp. SB140]|uniref:MarR family winged helix-turn-helix transcriptional regulator n=1 Tax=Desulfosporosinus paludis TaxID=3115649 RepID=UPI00389040E6